MRLMGGRQLDFALKKVTFKDQDSSWGERLLLYHFWPGRCLRMQSSSRLSRVNFQGSIIGCCSRTLLVYSFLGESLKFLVLDEEMMISVSCSSWVDGNSSKNSFLQFLVAVVSFLELSIGNASRFGSSLVQNLRLQSLPPLARPALTGYCSSKYPKKEVFSGEQCNLSDSAFLQAWVGSELSRGRLSRTEGVCLVGCSLFWKKSLGSLLLLILMRLGLPFGSLNL